MESRIESSTRVSRSSSNASRKSNLTLDLSNLPPLSQPTPPSNTLIFTNLNDIKIFSADSLASIRDLISRTAPIHTWAPLKSFRRVIVSFYDEEAAISVRRVWDGENVSGERIRVYFGQNTPLEAKDERLALPDAGKLFFISPPPSPPHGWEVRQEDAPNKLVHAEDLALALAKLRQAESPTIESPVTPGDNRLPSGSTRSRSSTLIYQPDDKSPNMPAVVVEDMTDGPDDGMSLESAKAIMAHTARPPVELMADS